MFFFRHFLSAQESLNKEVNEVRKKEKKRTVSNGMRNDLTLPRNLKIISRGSILLNYPAND